MRILKVVSSRTAEGRALLARAECNIGSKLFSVYERFSKAKAQAFLDVYTMYLNEGGTNFHITSANSFRFCVAWDVIIENGQHYTRYITPKYDYWIF